MWWIISKTRNQLSTSTANIKQNKIKNCKRKWSKNTKNVSASKKWSSVLVWKKQAVTDNRIKSKLVDLIFVWQYSLRYITFNRNNYILKFVIIRRYSKIRINTCLRQCDTSISTSFKNKNYSSFTHKIIAIIYWIQAIFSLQFS